jgi:hypothetical protein
MREDRGGELREQPVGLGEALVGTLRELVELAGEPVDPVVIVDQLLLRQCRGAPSRAGRERRLIVRRHRSAARPGRPAHGEPRCAGTPAVGDVRAAVPFRHADSPWSSLRTSPARRC